MARATVAETATKMKRRGQTIALTTPRRFFRRATSLTTSEWALLQSYSGRVIEEIARVVNRLRTLAFGPLFVAGGPPRQIRIR